MMRRMGRALVALSLLGALAACGADAAPTPLPVAPLPAATAALATGATGTLVLSTTAAEPAKKLKAFQPLADYLAAHLGAQGIHQGKVRFAPDAATLGDWLSTNKVDLFFDSLYPAMISGDKAGAHLILRQWRGGGAEYHTVFIALQDGPLTRLADLPGHLLAYEDLNSTAGYFLPTTYLIRAGLHPNKKAGPTATVGHDEVGYVFSGNNENSVQWVLTGRTAAAAIDSALYDALPAAGRAKLRILAETETVARYAVGARAGLDPALLAAIKAVLAGMDQAPEGQAVLKTFDQTARFDEFPAEPLAQIRKLYALLQAP